MIGDRVRAGLLTALLVCVLAGTSGVVRAQQGSVGVPRQTTLVNTVTIMPYVTGSFNSFTGQAFPEPAKGLGFGGGLTFDLTDPKQKLGLYFDFAFQSMRGSAANGACVIPGLGGTAGSDTLIEPADAYHYFEYVMFEPFLKVRGSKDDGYLLLGASFGWAVESETIAQPASGPSQGTIWAGTPYGRSFRLDLRLGLGATLAKFDKHEVVLEFRAGYPVTGAISNDFASACTGGAVGGWKILSMQANLGVRI